MYMGHAHVAAVHMGYNPDGQYICPLDCYTQYVPELSSVIAHIISTEAKRCWQVLRQLASKLWLTHTVYYMWFVVPAHRNLLSFQACLLFKN